MKKINMLLSIIAGVGLCSAINAAAPGGIGVVDMQQILKKSTKVSAASDKLKKQFAPEQSKLVAEQNQLKEMADKLNRDGAVMQQKDKDALQAKIETEQKSLMEKSQAFQQKAYEAQQKEMQALLDNVTSVVKDVAKKNNLTLVIDKSAVVYAGDEMDITSQVAKAFP